MENPVATDSVESKSQIGEFKTAFTKKNGHLEAEEVSLIESH